MLVYKWLDFDGLSHYTTELTHDAACVVLARTLVSSRMPTAAVRVCNVSHKPIQLHRGQSISILQNVKLAAELPTAESNESDAEQQRHKIVNNVDPSIPEVIKDELSELVEEYQDIFSYSEYDLGSTDLVMHEINTADNRPFRQPLRPQPRARLPVIDGLLTDMKDQGIIEPCQSEWASNIVLVKKRTAVFAFASTIVN